LLDERTVGQQTLPQLHQEHPSTLANVLGPLKAAAMVEALSSSFDSIMTRRYQEVARSFHGAEEIIVFWLRNVSFGLNYSSTNIASFLTFRNALAAPSRSS
jgi:hypothetical protein